MTETWNPNERSATYIFLDIVGFTRPDRTVQTRLRIIELLSSMVKESVAKYISNGTEKLYIPTGDGICIVLLDVDRHPELPLLIALQILSEIEAFNRSIPIKSRRFEVRIGIDANTDTLIKDINDRPNMAGTGINRASRILDLAGPNQILLGIGPSSRIAGREGFEDDKFLPFEREVKHSHRLLFCQFTDNEKFPFLNVEKPPGLKDELAKSIFINPPPERREAIQGRWVGMVYQREGPGPNREPLDLPIVLDLKMKGMEVTGNGILDWEGIILSTHIISGGFTADNYLKLDLCDIDPTVKRYFTIYFKVIFSASEKKLDGRFVGFAAEKDGLVDGTVIVDKDR